MDEPLSNLDAKLRVQTRSEIKQLQRQVGTTTVYVTHDQVEAMTMGDRVAVMNNGLLEQVGDTRAVYEHPANVFVAGFIGSPGMTFATLDASRNGGPTTLARGGMSLTVDPTGATEPIPGEVTIGIRPEHAHVWRDGGDLMGPIDGTVTFVEMLGREALLGVQVGDDQRFTVFADADATTAIGDRLSFGVERGRLYLFDPADERALGVV
jgi:ABC-type sugar transport system ATPase subunit